MCENRMETKISSIFCVSFVNEKWLRKIFEAIVEFRAFYPYLDGLVQKRRNSIANALAWRLFCTNPLICAVKK